MINAPKSGSRTIGVLILIQMAAGALVNFGLLEPVFRAPGFLVNAATHSTLVALSVLLGMAMGSLSVAIAITAFPVYRQYSQAMALWLISLSVVGLSVAVAENISVMSMLSLSESFAKAAATEHDLYQLLRGVVASTRNWSHYLGLLVSGSTLMVFYAALVRFALVPRALAIFGLVAVLLQLIAIAMPLFGHEVEFVMLAPLGLSQLFVAMWLIMKGWRHHS